jgi:preprotein translocase subunit SecG
MSAKSLYGHLYGHLDISQRRGTMKSKGGAMKKDMMLLAIVFFAVPLAVAISPAEPATPTARSF